MNYTYYIKDDDPQMNNQGIGNLKGSLHSLK